MNRLGEVPAEATFKGHYDEVGKGLPVLCLAGFGCSNWIFDEMSRDLADTACFIMPDNRGMGKSPPALERYEIEDLARDALLLMDTLEHKRFAMIGISMGGFIAECIWRMAPDRVTGMILMCTLGPGPQFNLPTQLTEDELRASYSLEPEILARSSVNRTTHPNLIRKNPARFQKIYEDRLANNAPLDQVLWQNRAVKAFLNQEIPFEQMDCPCLVMSGRDDHFVPYENSLTLATRIPRSDLVIVRETDHLFFLEKPAEVHGYIKRFLEGL